MTALGDRIAAAKRHPADLTYSEWVALLEEWERARDGLLAELERRAELCGTFSRETARGGLARRYWRDRQRGYEEAASLTRIVLGEPS